MVLNFSDFVRAALLFVVTMGSPIESKEDEPVVSETYPVMSICWHSYLLERAGNQEFNRLMKALG